MKTKLLLCFFSLLFISQYAFCTPLLPVDFEYVVDGDTIQVNSNKSSYRVRLYGIDCFEAKQNNRSAKQAKYFNITEDQVVCNGIKAREILKDKIGQQQKLFLKVYSVDHYGRMIAEPYITDFLFLKLTWANTWTNPDYALHMFGKDWKQKINNSDMISGS